MRIQWKELLLSAICILNEPGCVRAGFVAADGPDARNGMTDASEERAEEQQDGSVEREAAFSPLDGGTPTLDARSARDARAQADIAPPPDAAVAPDANTTNGLRVTFPDQVGIAFSVGATVEIRWTTGTARFVRLQLYDAERYVTRVTVDDYITNTGSFSWEIPKWVEPGNQYKIRVSDLEAPAALDFSDAPFTIR
jgi:hypothetical protein